VSGTTGQIERAAENAVADPISTTATEPVAVANLSGVDSRIVARDG
jgi:hypothetical protein